MLRTPAGLSAIYSRLQYKSPYAVFFLLFYGPCIPGRQKKALYINNDLKPEPVKWQVSYSFSIEFRKAASSHSLHYYIGHTI